MKCHQFLVTVKTTKTKASALSALLCSFGKRQPDGCEFHTIDYATFKRRQHLKIMRSCEESRRRLNSATEEQRAQLHADALKIINRARPA